MVSTSLSSALAILAATAAHASTPQPCTNPVSVLMTRASGAAATFTDGTWSTDYGLSSVNTASLRGSLYYTISEAIDQKTMKGNQCRRKNGVSFIHFYEMTVCNSPSVISTLRPSTSQFGPYVTFDEGTCSNEHYCKKLEDFGPWVGYQEEVNGVRNPTDGTAWYSLPGECTSMPWSKKTAECIAKFPSGKCASPNDSPNGIDCTWNYKLMGQVALDDLVGITSIKNEETGKNFTSSEEYCKAGFIEFDRDNTTFNSTELTSIDYWKDPLNKTANALRVVELVRFYHEGIGNANNIKLSKELLGDIPIPDWTPPAPAPAPAPSTSAPGDDDDADTPTTDDPKSDSNIKPKTPEPSSSAHSSTASAAFVTFAVLFSVAFLF